MTLYRSRDRYLASLAAFAVVAGVYLRFWDLGGAPLAVDEYYLGTSILNIVERGLPQFACGGYYMRALLMQYMTVPLIESGASLEFAVRFWPAVASVLTVVGVWRIAAMAGDTRIAAIAAILTSLSLWEIEFARFGRMYAPFQAVFVWYIYYQMQHLLAGSERARWMYLALSAVSIFVFSGAAFLLILNFLPLVWCGKKWTGWHLAVAAALLVFGVKFHTTSFRVMGIPVDQLPPESNPAPAEALLMNLPVRLPVLPELLLPILIVGFLVFAIALVKYRRHLFFGHPAALFWLLAALCLSFGLFGFALGLILAGLVLRLPLPAWENGPGQPLRRGILLIILWAAVVLASFWFGGEEFRSSLKSTVEYLFVYPDLYYRILRPWIKAIPVTTIAVVVLIFPVLLAAIRSAREPLTTELPALSYLLGTTILMLLLTPIFWQPGSNTRYTFFLYPLITILVSAGLMIVSTIFFPRSRHRLFILFALTAAFFLVSEDYSVRHMFNINEPEYRFRTAYDQDRAHHYYRRWDYRGVADYVNSNLHPGDKVVAFEDPVPFYLDHTEGAFAREGTAHHELVWACNGTRHVWSNAPLLANHAEVYRLIASTDDQVWLIMRTPIATRWIDPLEPNLVQRFALEPEYTSVDGHLAVYRIDAMAL